METFRTGQLVKRKDDEADKPLLVMLIRRDEKPIKCLALDEVKHTSGFLDFEPYSADELELFDPTKPAFLTQNPSRDLIAEIHPRYNRLLQYPTEQQAAIFTSVLDATEKNIGEADKALLNEGKARVRSKGGALHEVALEFMSNPRVELVSKAWLGHFMQEVTKHL